MIIYLKEGNFMMSYEEFKRRHRKVSKTVIMYYNKQWEEVSKENATFVRIAEFDEEGNLLNEVTRKS
jgi:hypothetical protein